MSQETRQCQNCKQSFAIEPEDFAFYEKMQVPAPTWCPECRMVRRLLFRNERNLYKRPCDLCNNEKILMYPKETSFSVYCKECWWSDKWDAKTYGRAYDFQKPFFKQLGELMLAVPRGGNIRQGMSVNSEYTNRVSDQRECYLVFGSSRDEFCRYGSWFNDARECHDGYNVQKSERCHECIDCFECYGIAFSQECTGCRDSWFLFDCRNCQDCFGCMNLRGKSYCIFNKQYSKEEYQRAIKQFDLSSAIFLGGMVIKFQEFKKNFIVPALVTHRSANASGNWVESSKNVFRSFNCRNVEDGRYCLALYDEKDAMDHCYWGHVSERIYETISLGIQCADVRFANECWEQVIDCQYVMNCHNSQHLFGCSGLRNAQYCILNKQYTKEEYEALVPKIRQHMDDMPYHDANGREYKYGEFFPPEISPHAYNETLAQEFFPLDKSQAEQKGFAWKEDVQRDYKITMPADELPDRIDDAPETLANEIIGCAHRGACNQRCTTAFKILAEDIRMYKTARLPLPRLCPNCRHFERLAKRNPLKLWPRKCQCAGGKSDNGVYTNTNSSHPSHGMSDHCPKEFETSYAPDRKEIVYCEACYNAEVA